MSLVPAGATVILSAAKDLSSSLAAEKKQQILRCARDDIRRLPLFIFPRALEYAAPRQHRPHPTDPALGGPVPPDLPLLLPDALHHPGRLRRRHGPGRLPRPPLARDAAPAGPGRAARVVR